MGRERDGIHGPFLTYNSIKTQQLCITYFFSPRCIISSIFVGSCYVTRILINGYCPSGPLFWLLFFSHFGLYHYL